MSGGLSQQWDLFGLAVFCGTLQRGQEKDLPSVELNAAVPNLAFF